jgi:hypothetical protein
MDATDSGSISAGGRFDRIEQTLTRIELKLDSKVDNSDFAALRQRVEVMENGESPMARFVMKQFEDVQARVNEITLHGSAQAQEATAAIKAVEKDVEVLRFESQSGRALMSNKHANQNRNIKLWAILVSAIAAASAAGTLVMALTS